MGQRGGGAAFMPDKFVFPGGAVDAEDVGAARRAAARSRRPPAGSRSGRRPRWCRACRVAAVRELWEETGLMLGPARRRRRGARRCRRHGAGFFAAGLVPHTAALRFVFRAVTPPGRPRRFDARFFLAEAARARGRRTTTSPARARSSPSALARPRRGAGAAAAVHHRGGAVGGRGAPRRPGPGAAGALLPPDAGGIALPAALTLDRRGEGVERRLWIFRPLVRPGGHGGKD